MRAPAIGTALCELETPALLLDESRLQRNLDRMATTLAARDVSLRPHVKTSKCIEVVRRALRGQPGGITVSTLDEAEYFFAHGILDILYAVGIAPNKLRRIGALIEAGADLTVTVDSVAMATELARFARDSGLSVNAVIELDCDGHRSGVRPESDTVIEIGRVLAGANGLRGVMTHAGESYQRCGPEAVAAIAELERIGAVKAADRLRAAGLRCEMVSVGSTPTALFGGSASGLTEVRAGVYMFFDLFQAGIGVCSIDDIAISVLTTVIGHQEERGWLITDAGWTALSSDQSTAKQSVNHRHGLVMTIDGRKPIDDLVVVAANQEHGIVSLRNGGVVDTSSYPVGSMLRVLPNHACSMAAAFANYIVVTPDGRVGDRWSRLHGHAVFGSRDDAADPLQH
jgi:D-serine deaminase-like pyridoxal phosphate-dependent protein